MIFPILLLSLVAVTRVDAHKNQLSERDMARMDCALLNVAIFTIDQKIREVGSFGNQQPLRLTRRRLVAKRYAQNCVPYDFAWDFTIMTLMLLAGGYLFFFGSSKPIAGILIGIALLRMLFVAAWHYHDGSGAVHAEKTVSRA